MARKKNIETGLLIAGAGVAAYLLLKSRAKPVTYAAPPVAASNTGLLSILAPAGSFLKNLFPSSTPSPSDYLPTASSTASLQPISPGGPLTVESPAEDITTPLPQTASDILAGFYPVKGTGLALIGCAACAAAMGKHQNRVGKIDYNQFIVPGALLIGGYLLLKNFGIFNNNTSAANAKTDASVKQSTAAALNQAAAQGDFATLTDAQCQGIATDIYTQGIATTVNQDQIEHDLIQANTLTDLLKIKQYFGTNPVNTGSWYNWCALFRVNCTAVDLDTFVKAVLDSDHLNSVNSYLSAQGINYQF